MTISSPNGADQPGRQNDPPLETGKTAASVASVGSAIDMAKEQGLKGKELFEATIPGSWAFSINGPSTVWLLPREHSPMPSVVIVPLAGTCEDLGDKSVQANVE